MTHFQQGLSLKVGKKRPHLGTLCALHQQLCKDVPNCMSCFYKRPMLCQIFCRIQYYHCILNIDLSHIKFQICNLLCHMLSIFLCSLLSEHVLQLLECWPLCLVDLY